MALKLVFVTSNPHKVKEIKEILSDYDLDIVSPKEIGISMPEIIEDGISYQENALIKARALSGLTKEIVFADDSGLEIKSMGNKPGLESARYAASFGGHKYAFPIIFNNIKGKDRSARFVCDIALIDGDTTKVFEGICPGHISEYVRGDNGFGYDPIFIPDGYDKSYAELGDEEKNRISHRGRALFEMVKYLKEHYEI